MLRRPSQDISSLRDDRGWSLCSIRRRRGRADRGQQIEQSSVHPGWLFDIGDDILPMLYRDYFISQYKPTRSRNKPM